VGPNPTEPDEYTGSYTQKNCKYIISNKEEDVN